jgi:hypothetical protein
VRKATSDAQSPAPCPLCSPACTKITFALILAFMQEHYCHIPHMCGPSTWFLPSACVRISPDELAKLPAITFKLGTGRGDHFDLELRPEDYMVESVVGGESLRCVGFMALDALTPGTDIIFGNVRACSVLPPRIFGPALCTRP